MGAGVGGGAATGGCVGWGPSLTGVSGASPPEQAVAKVSKTAPIAMAVRAGGLPNIELACCQSAPTVAHATIVSLPVSDVRPYPAQFAVYRERRYQSGIMPGVGMTLRTSEKQTEALRRQAVAEGRSMQAVALSAIDEYIERRAHQSEVNAVLDKVIEREHGVLRRLADT